jgi:DNA segregation ATPase FtsK/SpoIIIE, S-DNA-T family
MELFVEVVHGVDASTDVVLDVEPGATFGELADSFEFLRAVPNGGTLQIARTGQTPRRDDRVADVDVRSGDRLTLVDSVNAAFSVTPEAFGASLTVTAPTGAETEYPLRYGDNSLGRDPDNDVVIKDQQASRHHARITVTDVITIADLGSKNGIVVGDTAIVTPTILRPGQIAQLGDLTLSVDNHLRALEAIASRNRIEFNRPPRIDRAYAGVELEIPAPPERPRRQRLPMISAVLPVLMGIVMYFLIGPLGAIFMLLSPVLLIGSAIEAKRTGQYEFRDALAEHREIVDEQVQFLEIQRLEEIRGRFRELPAAKELGGLVRSLSDRLWERAPDDPDFLRLRAGTAVLPSRTRVKVVEGGARDLRKELDEIPGRFRLLDDVPLPLDLRELGGVGIAGPLAAGRALARSLVLQAATMHSPTDLAVMALVGEPARAEWEFLKWLPHARSLGGVQGAQLASTSHHALGLVNDLLQSRAGAAGDSGDSGRGSITLPAALVLIDETCPVERRRLMPLLEAPRRAGIFFVWVGSARHRLPKACGAVVEIDPDHVTASTGFTRSGVTVSPTRWEGQSLADATAVARNLTPIIDVTGRVNDDSGIPSSVSFADLYGGGHVLDDPASLLELWQQRDGGGERHGLRVVVGTQAGAPFVLDVRQDGPHALVAGTTGAGKSEFLQSLVVGLATMHSPERVTFLLVDYKGGAAFKECVELPHTVGLVTDLDRNEVRRALISLNAELHHRELLLQKADAKDLLEMERKGHPDTPPSLLIVVDEFAALAKEVPEFVDGVVDVALRGRSLGLHLVLATQRPAGVITGQIRANTNLRVALRMASDDESDDVVGSPVAAAIERRLPGRAVARIGPQELVPFQSAYVGGHTMADVQAPSVQVRVFGFDHDVDVAPERKVAVPSDHPSDLQRLVVTHRSAFGLLGAPLPRRPWLPSLALSYELGRLPRPTDEAALVVGVIDQPARQLQSLASFSPDKDGGLLILGTGGSGKTVALRTIAVSAGLAAEATGQPFEIHALDFAGRGLDVLEELPHVGSVIAGEDTERVTRLLRNLRERLDQRAIEFAAVRASSLPEYRRNAREGSPVPRVLVLLDSYPGFQATHERIDGGKWLDLFARLVADGRQVGVHFVITADRRTSIPMTIGSAIPRKLVLRLSNDDEYLNAGEPVGILSPKSPPGRAIMDRTEVQVAVLGGSSNGERQAAEISALADRLTRGGVARAPAVGVLPDEFRRSTLAIPSTPDRLMIAIGDRDLQPRGIPLDQGSVLVTGPPRSGRTTALATIAQSAAAVGIPLFHLHTRQTPLAHAPFWRKVARGPSDGAELVGKLVELAGRIEGRTLVIVDDLADLADTEADAALSELLRVARDHPITVIAAVDNTAARRQYSGTIPDMRKDGIAVLLQPDTDSDGDLVGVSLPRRTRGAWPEGRGYLAERGAAELVHVALPDPW